MAVADFLEKVGEGAATAGRVAGAVGSSLGKRTAEVLSGEAPEIDEEERQKKTAYEGAALSARTQELESQLETGRKYGTLTPAQQQEYVDAITKLYSHPSQMGTLVQKLHKAVHPQGATYQPNTPLPNATPEGGTSAADASRALELANVRRTMREYTSPDSTQREWFTPGQEPEGWNAAAGTPKTNKPMTVRMANGQPGFAYPQPDGTFKDQSGQVIQASPFIKPPVNAIKSGVSQGKNAYAQLTDEGWIDAGTKQPLPDFRPAPTFAETGMFSLDTSYDQNGNAVGVLLDRRTGKVTPAPAGLVATAQTKNIETARAGLIGADTRLRNMLLMADRAKKGDQQAMLGLVANHIGMTLGAQKGARINQAVWNEAVESAPWLARVQAKWGPDGYLVGVALTPDQIDQMVELGKLGRQTAAEAFAQQAAASGIQEDISEFQQNFTPPSTAKPVKPGQILPKTGAHTVGGNDPLGVL